MSEDNALRLHQALVNYNVTDNAIPELIAAMDARYQRVAEPEAPKDEAVKCPVCGEPMGKVAYPCVCVCPEKIMKGICSNDRVEFYCTQRTGCYTTHWSRDSRGPYIRKRYSAADGSLVIDFWLRDKLLEMQVVEQDERWRRLDPNAKNVVVVDGKIFSDYLPELYEEELFIRGRDRAQDKDVSALEFSSTRAALEAMLAWGKLIQTVKLPERKRPEPRVGMMVNHEEWDDGPYPIAGREPCSSNWKVLVGQVLAPLPPDWQPVE